MRFRKWAPIKITTNGVSYFEENEWQAYGNLRNTWAYGNGYLGLREQNYDADLKAPMWNAQNSDVSHRITENKSPGRGSPNVRSVGARDARNTPRHKWVKKEKKIANA